MLGKAQGQIDAIFLALGTKADATSTLALINQKVSSVLLGVANGVATLGSDGKVPTGQLPATSNITWQNLTIVAGATVSSDAVYPMQIGKDSRNNVYLRGMFASTKNGTLDANLPLLLFLMTLSLQQLTRQQCKPLLVVRSLGRYKQILLRVMYVLGLLVVSSRLV